MVGPLFLCFFNAAEKVAIGAKLYYHAKVWSFRDSIRVSVIIYRVSVFVYE